MRNLVKYVGIGLLVMGLAACFVTEYIIECTLHD